METLEQSLNALIASEAWPGIVVGLRIGLAVVVLRMVMLMAWYGRGKTSTKQSRSGLIPSQWFMFAPLVFLFVISLGYQASWQLFGRSRPKFVQFMQKYDRRQFNPAHSITRGRILDREGRIIAYSLKKRDRIERHYRLGPMFAHLVGYADARYGMTGLENAAHTYLIGGGLGSLKDWQALGKELVERSESKPGQDLKLTLDVELQQVAYRALKDQRGAAVLMDVKDGAVLALVSAPAFDPNRIDREIRRAEAEGATLLNRATQGLYPPGSTFKVVVAAAAFKQGWTGTLDCPAEGYTTSSTYPKIRDHEYYAARERGAAWAGHGAIDITTALVKSSNVFFAQLGVALGHGAMKKTTADFGLNDELHIYETLGDKLYATRSRYPKIAKSDKYGLAQVSIGQGKLLVTPLQMCLVAAAIANDGVMMQPRVGLDQSPKKLQRSMSEPHANLLATMMQKVVSRGTGRGMATAGFSSGGKTGTAQNPHGEAHGWYIGFAPYHDPQVAVCVLVENGGYGSTSALPVARALLKQAHELEYFTQP